MLRGLIGGIVGKKAAQAVGGGAAGAAVGAALPFIAARGLGPLGLAITGLWVAKKVKDKIDRRRTPTYPETATPAAPPAA
ncbi:hypothetical protein [Sphingomicrobium marinum]|uniref:hypothetical protein n=1 Tax=Sphingomicrobium marinum TaxID=1227950 RepID=UPI00223F85D3|nr:hypothetical protein [Sphingomicrobium marinum]